MPLCDNSMDSMWHQHGQFVKSAWPVCDISMASIWHRMASKWNKNGQYVISAWLITYISLASMLNQNGQYVISAWIVCYISIASMWYQHGQCVISAWPLEWVVQYFKIEKWTNEKSKVTFIWKIVWWIRCRNNFFLQFQPSSYQDFGFKIPKPRWFIVFKMTAQNTQSEQTKLQPSKL